MLEFVGLYCKVEFVDLLEDFVELTNELVFINKGLELENESGESDEFVELAGELIDTKLEGVPECADDEFWERVEFV